jgi:hypothetical protein
MEDFGIFCKWLIGLCYGYLLYIEAIWYILFFWYIFSRLGMLYGRVCEKITQNAAQPVFWKN